MVTLAQEGFALTPHRRADYHLGQGVRATCLCRYCVWGTWPQSLQAHGLFSHPHGPSAACGSGSRSSGATPVSGPPPPSASSTPAGQPPAISRLQMQLHLRGLQSSTSDLRGQLQQLRKLQVPPPPGPRPV